MISHADLQDGRELSISAVYITDELKRRLPKKTDYLKEKVALQDLAVRMADQPDEILPRFVDLAMEMTGGSSAGISLLEDKPLPGIFRWHYVRGNFVPFDGATTPRNFSPCGVTLDANEPVLSTYPERVYDWIMEAGISVPEVLLVPLYLGGQEPLGTLWIVSDEVGHFDQGHARVATELAAFAGIAIRMRRTEQHLQQALNEQQTLAMEMSHRVKNLFAMVDGLIRLSASGAGSKEQMARDLSGRLRALTDAHGLIRRNAGDTASPNGASYLGELVGTILRPHIAVDGQPGARFSVSGPAIQCSQRAANGIALVLHELATNALKYGALQADDGHIDVNWRVQADQLMLSWTERGGPEITTAPEANGFGSTLARKMVIRQFGGDLRYDWRPGGLTVSIDLPVDQLSA
jgi:two-component sensor histidine kinase